MTRTQQTTLVAAILGSADSDDRRLDRQRRLAGDRGRPRWRVVGAAVGVERLPADARIADPDRRLDRGHLRRATRVRDRPSGVRRLLGRVRARTDDRGVDRRPRAAGCGGGAHGSELARDHRRRLRAARARGGDRSLDRLGRDRGDRRPARRRRDRRPGLLALDLRAQRPARARDLGTRP